MSENPYEPPPKPHLRAWYRLHWLTCLVCGVLVWAIVDTECERRFVGGASSFGYVFLFDFGWPQTHLNDIESGILGPRPGDPEPTHEYQWKPIGLTVNLSVCVIFLAATAYVCEAWLRRRKRWQFSLRQFLIATAMVRVLLGTVRIDSLPPVQIHWLGCWFELGRPLHWPLLLGFVCAVDASVALSLYLMLRLVALRTPQVTEFPSGTKPSSTLEGPAA